MKKIILSFFMWLLIMSTANSQNILKDAVSLAGLVNTSSGEWPENNNVKTAVTDILSHYCKRDDISKIFLTDNEFIRDYAANWTSKSGTGFTGPMSTDSKSKGLLDKIGGINVTNIADGLARFLIERAKQELSISFFRQFQETLDSKEYKHLRTLFSNTTSLLRTIDRDIYKFTAYLQALRDAFIKDLNNLFDTAPQAIQDGLLRTAFSNASPSYLKELFLYALQLTKAIKNGMHPGEMLEKFNLINPSAAASGLTDINAILRIVKIFSASLKSDKPESNKYWASGESIKSLFTAPQVFKIYLGLVYHQAEGILFTNGTQFRALMASALSDLSTYESFVRNTIEKFNAIQENLAELSEKKKDERSYSDYYNFFNSVLAVLNIDDNLKELPGLKVVFPDMYKKFTSLAENCNEFFLDINMKKYSSGVMRVIAIFDEILKPAYDNYVRTTSDPLAKYEDLRKNLIKYGTFIASVAEAQDAEEVKAAIEAALLPVGSSSIKRESYFNISLNAFIGPFAGTEYLPKLKDNEWKFVAGVAAPVGVAFSWGKIKNTKDPMHKKSRRPIGNKSISLFVPLIDVGAMASFRIKDDSSKVASEVKLANIIAPGFYVYYGFGKCPVSIGIGGQVGPQLREVTATNINVDKNVYIRFGLNIVVDIPFFNFYTKTGNIKRKF